VSLDVQQAQFHVGVRVADLESSMAALSAGLGLRWAQVVEREQDVWTPEAGAHQVPLRFTYSCDGPQHVELLQGSPGSVWDGTTSPGIHHVGVWVDDIAAEVERLVGVGWTLEAAGRPPEDGYGPMAYVRAPDGTLLEPVSSDVRPRFERWWAGGPFA
jgi:catechol 2,3-dioxygenase-like lactoylglutathione lyase family enzyme